MNIIIFTIATAAVLLAFAAYDYLLAVKES